MIRRDALRLAADDLNAIIMCFMVVLSCVHGGSPGQHARIGIGSSGDGGNVRLKDLSNLIPGDATPLCTGETRNSVESAGLATEALKGLSLRETNTSHSTVQEQEQHTPCAIPREKSLVDVASEGNLNFSSPTHDLPEADHGGRSSEGNTLESNTPATPANHESTFQGPETESPDDGIPESVEYLELPLLQSNSEEMALQGIAKLKLAGNQAFSTGNVSSAMQSYSDGLAHLQALSDSSSAEAQSLSQELRLNMAQCCLRMREFQQAAGFVSGALSERNSAKGRFRLAKAYKGLGKTDDAAIEAYRALAISPKDSSIRGLCEGLVRRSTYSPIMGRVDEIAEQAHRKTGKNATLVSLHAMCGMLLQKNAEGCVFDAALNHFDPSVSKSPVLVAFVATHIDSLKRLECLSALARSIQEQITKVRVYVSWSANDECKEHVRDLLEHFKNTEGWIVREQAKRMSRFEHFNALHACLRSDGGADWVLFSDDDDLWHPQRTNTMLWTILGRPLPNAVIGFRFLAQSVSTSLRHDAERPLSAEQVEGWLKSGRAVLRDGVRDAVEYWQFVVKECVLRDFFSHPVAQALLPHSLSHLAFRTFVCTYKQPQCRVAVSPTLKRGDGHAVWMYHYNFCPPTVSRLRDKAESEARSPDDLAKRHAAEQNLLQSLEGPPGVDMTDDFMGMITCLRTFFDHFFVEQAFFVVKEEESVTLERMMKLLKGPLLEQRLTITPEVFDCIAPQCARYLASTVADLKIPGLNMSLDALEGAYLALVSTFSTVGANYKSVLAKPDRQAVLEET